MGPRRTFGWFAVAVLLGGSAGPSCAAFQRQCPVAASPGAAMGLLRGAWTIADCDGNIEGQILFDPDTFTATWDDVTLFGTWEHVQSRESAHQIELTVERAIADGIEERYGALEQVTLTLAFVDADRLYAMQSGGSWTEWARLPQ